MPLAALQGTNVEKARSRGRSDEMRSKPHAGLTNAFSKKLENMKAALALHFATLQLLLGSPITKSDARYGSRN
jgi:hypothetical protein